MTITPTRDTPSLTRIEVHRSADGGRSRVTLDCSGPPDRPVVRPMLLSSDGGGARVSLVPEGALLLAGDAVSIEVVVGAGARLELVEPAGTVAYAMSGGRASWDVSMQLEEAATLVWAGEPFVVAEGAVVDRRTTVRMAPDARLALREVLVLGRHGERPGHLFQEFDAVGPGDVPILVESLRIDGGSSRLLLGGARVVGTVTVLGARLPGASDATTFDLEAEGTVVRRLAAAAHEAVPARAWLQARHVVREICTSTRNSMPSALAR